MRRARACAALSFTRGKAKKGVGALLMQMCDFRIRYQPSANSQGLSSGDPVRDASREVLLLASL